MATTTNYGWTTPDDTSLVKDGASAIRTLGSDIDSSLSALYNGTSGAWTSYTPTYANLTLGNGTVVAAYKQYGKMVVVRFVITLGSTSSVGTAPTISHPVTGRTGMGNNIHVGSIDLADTGTANYKGVIRYAGTTSGGMFVEGVAGTYSTLANITATIPHTWASTDIISGLYFYEAA
jgi:hypothetical protein